MDFCKEFRFERMGAFAYSEEDGTRAAELPEQARLRFTACLHAMLDCASESHIAAALQLSQTAGGWSL